MQPHSEKKPNPFSSSRVDTPFQNHIDLKEIYQDEFERLKSILVEIKRDVDNHQSRGAVVIGEPGTGKTHLMMRLAKEYLVTNRLLFIRQPNNLNSVLYHTYSRVLESLVEPVPNSPYSQLEYLLANSFAKIILETFQNRNASTGIFDYFRKLTSKDRHLKEILSENPLNIYHKLGKEGARNKREYWQHIEIIIDDWWKSNYGDVGYSTTILHGIVKFCSYSELNKKKLVGKWLSANELEPQELENIGLKNWPEEISQEAFSLDAMTVFGRLSIMDEPLLIIFDQLEALGLQYNQNLLQSFGEALKEIFTHIPNSLIILNLFPERWEQFQHVFDTAVLGRISQEQLTLTTPSQEQLRQILTLKAQEQSVNIDDILLSEDFADILAQKSIRDVLNRASHYYRFRTQGIPVPVIPHQTKSFEQQIQEELKTIKQEITTPRSTTYQTTNHFESEVKEGLKTIQAEIAALRQIIESTLIKPSPSPSISPLIMPIEDDPPQLSPSSINQPIIDYLDREKIFLEENYEKLIIISDNDDIGKLITVTKAFDTVFKNIEIDYLRLGKRKLPEHCLIKTPTHSSVIGFLQVSPTVFPKILKNFNELVITHQEINFMLFRDVRESPITGKTGREEINKLNQAPNGKFIELDKENRITFELIYQLITDIQNRDVDFELKEALETLQSYLGHYWLINIFNVN